jgi:ubiquinone/menaquinone biosynthesis C-methylase UbiE
MAPLTWTSLYSHYTEEYELLVSHEDYQHNLEAAIERLQPLEGCLAAEFGAGTGRLTALLAARARQVHAFDLTPSMLWVAQRKQRAQKWANVFLALADSREMPTRCAWADFAIQGWAFLHIAVWHPDDWQVQIGRALDEMERVVRPDGRMILIETLGTGETSPNPSPAFRRVYDHLEGARRFQPLDLRTDYLFEDMAQIHKVVVPLFGEAMLERLIPDGEGFILPECTGLWWRDAPGDPVA